MREAGVFGAWFIEVLTRLIRHRDSLRLLSVAPARAAAHRRRMVFCLTRRARSSRLELELGVVEQLTDRHASVARVSGPVRGGSRFLFFPGLTLGDR